MASDGAASLRQGSLGPEICNATLILNSSKDAKIRRSITFSRKLKPFFGRLASKCFFSGDIKSFLIAKGTAGNRYDFILYYIRYNGPFYLLVLAFSLRISILGN